MNPYDSGRKLDMYLLTCYNQLGDFSGNDVDSAKCKCQAMDANDTYCPPGHNGVQTTVRTESGLHYYILAMARPPYTGEAAHYTFKLGVSDASGERWADV